MVNIAPYAAWKKVQINLAVAYVDTSEDMSSDVCGDILFMLQNLFEQF